MSSILGCLDLLQFCNFFKCGARYKKYLCVCEIICFSVKTIKMVIAIYFINKLHLVIKCSVSSGRSR